MGKAGYPTKSITSQLPSQTEKKGLKKELRKWLNISALNTLHFYPILLYECYVLASSK